MASSIEVSIIDDTSRRDCDADCGVNWSSPDDLSLASRQLESRFGIGARLQYSDLSLAAPDDPAQQWRQTIRERGLSVPLLLINGRLRVAGRFDIRQLVDAVEAELEIGT